MVRPSRRGDNPRNKRKERIDGVEPLKPRRPVLTRTADDVRILYFRRVNLRVLKIEFVSILECARRRNRDNEPPFIVVRRCIVREVLCGFCCRGGLNLERVNENGLIEHDAPFCDRTPVSVFDLCFVFCRVKDVDKDNRLDSIELELRIHDLGKRVFVPVLRISKRRHRLIPAVANNRSIDVLRGVSRQMDRGCPEYDGQSRRGVYGGKNGSRYFLHPYAVKKCHILYRLSSSSCSCTAF